MLQKIYCRSSNAYTCFVECLVCELADGTYSLPLYLLWFYGYEHHIMKMQRTGLLLILNATEYGLKENKFNRFYSKVHLSLQLKWELGSFEVEFTFTLKIQCPLSFIICIVMMKEVRGWNKDVWVVVWRGNCHHWGLPSLGQKICNKKFNFKK